MASVLVQADNDDDMLATLNLRKPSREQFRGAEASAATHLIGRGEGGANPRSMFGKQIWMTLGYMRFALSAELDFTTEIGTKNRVMSTLRIHHPPSFREPGAKIDPIHDRCTASALYRAFGAAAYRSIDGT